jgi:hypothetical protein
MNGRLNQIIRMIAMITILFPAGAVLATDRAIEELEVEPGQKVDIDLKDGGSVSVEGWNKNIAEIRYSERNGSLDRFKIEIKKTRSGVKIVASLEDRSDHYSDLHFDIRVPRQFDVEFHTAGGGLDLTGLEGDFTGKTMGGGLTLHDVNGEVSLKTMGGSIEVTDSELDGKIHTMGGSVRVENVIGDLRASSNGGNVEYKNVRLRNGKQRAPGNLDDEDITRNTVTISSMGGGVNVTDAPEGASIYTGGGEVMVRGADKFVDARTGGGDMDIRIKSGWIKAWTGAGDIYASIVEDTGDDEARSTFFTGLGDVTIVLPADLSVEFDIDLGYTKKSSRDFKITSDFDIDQEHTDEWDYSNGSPRKHIYGTGEIAGGHHLIKIRTTNGNVRIKKK